MDVAAAVGARSRLGDGRGGGETALGQVGDALRAAEHVGRKRAGRTSSMGHGR
jgi:hypothetical protein